MGPVFGSLCARLRPFPPAERQAQLQAWQGAGAEDPQVLSLVTLHCALPPDPGRDRTGERLGHLTLEEPLGAGGRGVVYRAQQHLGAATRPVAVKLLHPTFLRIAREEALAQFLAELPTLSTLQHESIVRLYDGGLYDDPHTHECLPYIAMELVQEGLPLTAYARDYALSWQERLAVFVRLCPAVRYAHAHRVVPRDLKPTNMLVDSDGRPVVIDCGLAQAGDAVLPGALLAASGTPAYLSPEQVSEAFGTVSEKSDVYALGLILYELLTGQPPYALPRDGSVAQWCQVILEAMPPPLRQYNAAYGEELEAILAAALAKRPAERITVAVLRSRLARDLQKLAPAIDGPQHATRPLRPGTPPAERRHLTVMGCALVESTARASQLDPEAYWEVARTSQATWAEVIHHFGGHIAQSLGDGVLVYFGYPHAHDDDARRAVHAGLGLLEAMPALPTRLAQDKGIRLALRVGMHTGLTVVGEIGGGQPAPLALGDTPHVAARLQRYAAPDTVVISEAVYRLIHGYCRCQDLGRPTLPGVTTPLAVYRVLGGVLPRVASMSRRPKDSPPWSGARQRCDSCSHAGSRCKRGEGRSSW